MADNMHKGLTYQSGFAADKQGPAMHEKKQRQQKASGAAGKKGGKSFSFG
jgi:hypothetical protein